jgi:deoxyribonuclease-4
MWRAGGPDPAQIRALRAIRERWDLRPLAIHANYLVNLASPDAVIRAKSIDCFPGEVERAAAIGAEFLVVHPGSYRGRAVEDRVVEEGIGAFVLGLRDSTRGLAPRGLTILIENTAGAGAQLGSRFPELRSIRELSAGTVEIPVGFCLDTCHLLAAGFDISRAAGLRTMLRSAALWPCWPFLVHVCPIAISAIAGNGHSQTVRPAPSLNRISCGLTIIRRVS